MGNETILLKGELRHNEEGIAEGTITPGDLIDFNLTSGKVQRHDVSGGNTSAMFAKENDLQGDGIDVDYTVGKLVQYLTPVPGDQIYALLTTSQTIKKGNFLASNGDGKLKKYVVSSGEPDYVKAIVVMAMEDKTTTAAVARIVARVV